MSPRITLTLCNIAIAIFSMTFFGSLLLSSSAAARIPSLLLIVPAVSISLTLGGLMISIRAGCDRLFSLGLMMLALAGPLALEYKNYMEENSGKSTLIVNVAHKAKAPSTLQGCQITLLANGHARISRVGQVPQRPRRVKIQDFKKQLQAACPKGLKTLSVS